VKILSLGSPHERESALAWEAPKGGKSENSLAWEASTGGKVKILAWEASTRGKSANCLAWEAPIGSIVEHDVFDRFYGDKSVKYRALKETVAKTWKYSGVRF